VTAVVLPLSSCAFALPAELGQLQRWPRACDSASNLACAKKVRPFRPQLQCFSHPFEWLPQPPPPSPQIFAYGPNNWRLWSTCSTCGCCGKA